ncbi:MAG: calcium-binding protein [Acidimicrobiales bacterium]|nr:MAG: calcium-binding protein [Acidimicrobiales bacterium]
MLRTRSIRMAIVATLLVASALAGVTSSVEAQGTATCAGVEATIVGTEGNDVLLGTEGPDVIAGLGGNDIIRGFGGADIICGDNGRDKLFGGRGTDIIFGGKKNDIVKGDGGPDLLYGNQGHDRLIGGAGADYLEGGSGLIDRLTGKAGVDTCVDRQPNTVYATCEDPQGPVPARNTPLDVIGVEGSDVLNFRLRPDANSRILATAAPALEGFPQKTIIGTGVGQSNGPTLWWQATIDGETAWASQEFLGMLGVTSDILAQLQTTMTSLEADSIQELGDAVAQARSGAPEVTTAVVVEVLGVDASSSLATIDVIGLGDDASKGERVFLNLFNIRDIDATEFVILGYRITGATATDICGRGIAANDFCV